MSSHNRIIDALKFIPADDRDTWVTMAMAVKSELNDEGFDVWDGWSQQAESYKTDDARAVWKSIHPDGGVTIGTLFHKAKANGWDDNGIQYKVTPEELALCKHKAAARAASEQEAIQQERERAASNAMAIWKSSTPVQPGQPYLERKQVSPVDTLREIDTSQVSSILSYQPKSGGEHLTGRLLVVPIKQDDNLSTLELIDGDGRKAALAGRGTKAGGYWATQELPRDKGEGVTLLIGEGVATVLSASEATGHTGIAALSSGNLQAVTNKLHARYPAARLVLLADLMKVTGAPDPHAIASAKSVNAYLAVPDFGSNRDSGMTDFNDLAVHRGFDVVRQAIQTACPAVGMWPQPQPLTAKQAPEPYPLDALPDTIRAAVEEVVGFVQAPIPLVASSALAALSLAIQAHVDIKRADRLHGPAGLFLLTIADSGERKSTCDGFFTKAIKDYEAEQAEAAKPASRDYKAELKAWEAKSSGVKDKIRQLAKEGKSTKDMDEALRELEHDIPEEPRVPKLLLGDETPEHLAWALAKKWPSGGVVSSEAGIVFGSHGMGKDSVMRNLGLLNILWDGGALSIGRRTSESYTVQGARLTVALQVQEPTLREFFNKSGALARGTGFLARFLVAWPASTQGFRPFTEAPANWPALEAFNQRLAAMLNQPAPIDEDGRLTPAMLSLSPEAKRAWVEYHDAVEQELASGGELHDVRDVASKSADNAARLAALFQMFEHGTGAVSVDCFESANRIAAWHLHEARRFFGELALPEELAGAARLDDWLIEYCQRERTHLVRKNTALQYGPLRKKDSLDAAIKELAELERLKTRKDGKSTVLAVNPSLLGFATATPAIPAISGDLSQEK